MASCNATFWTGALLCFALLIAQSETQTQYGQHFVVAIPYGKSVSGTPSNLDLVLTNPNTAEVTVSLQYQGTVSNILLRAKTAWVENRNGSTDMLPERNGVYDRTIVLTATLDFGVHMRGEQAYDGFMAIPVASWGIRYAVLTHCHGNDSVCQLVVLAHKDFTYVKVDIPAENHGPQADDPGTMYATGANETKVLMKNEAWVVQRPYELSSAIIKSNVSVGVLVGAQWTTYSGRTGAVNEQLPPLTALGKDHVTLVGGMVRVIATEPRTTVHFGDSDPVTLTLPGQWYQFWAKNATYLRADRPLAVIQVGTLGASGNSYPMMTFIQPCEQFLDINIKHIVPHLSVTNQALYIVTKIRNVGKIVYGGASVSSAASRDAANSDFTVLYQTKADTLSVLLETSGDPDLIAVYLEAKTATAGFVTPLAAQYQVINPLRDCGSTAQAEPGDTVDNDCDGQVDEDVCGAGAGIDCMLRVTGGVRDVWGTDFLLVVPEYLGNLSSVNFTLAFTTRIASNVTVKFNLPGEATATQSITDASPYTYLFGLSPNHVLAGDRSSRAIRVWASSEVSVTFGLHGVMGSQSTGGTMRLLPLDVLGNEYYVVTVCAKAICHFQVAGVFADTQVNIYLRLNPPSTSNVTFEGVTYKDYDVIRTTVGKDEGLQVTCSSGCEMTGTLVSGSKPLGVFSISELVDVSGRKMAFDHLIEQMPPVTSYGTEFFVRLSPDRIITRNSCNLFVCYDSLYVLASQPNTNLRVADEKTLDMSGVVEYTISSAGGYLKLNASENTTQLISDKPVLVVQVLPNLMSGNGGMLVVTPLGQFCDQDVYAFQPSSLNITKYLVVYTTDLPAPAITVDGVSRSYITQVAGPLLNASYFILEFSSASDTFFNIKSSSGRFAGYIDTRGEMEDLAALAFTLEPNQEECLITKPVRADGIDNDCDGLVDEEPCPIGDEEADTDGDERFNEDCEALPEETSIAPPTLDDVTTSSLSTLDDVTTSSLSTLDDVTTSSLSTLDDTTTSLSTLDDATDSSLATQETTTESPETTTLEPDTTAAAPTPGTGASEALTSQAATPSLPESVTSISSAKPSPFSSMCGCNCPPWIPTTSLASESLTSMLESIRQELYVEKSELSATRRRKISIPDDRPSAQTVGYMGVVIIAGVIIGIFLLDVGALHRDLSNLIHACRGT